LMNVWHMRTGAAQLSQLSVRKLGDQSLQKTLEL